jgi:hypothetical protein
VATRITGDDGRRVMPFQHGRHGALRVRAAQQFERGQARAFAAAARLRVLDEYRMPRAVRERREPRRGGHRGLVGRTGAEHGQHGMACLGKTGWIRDVGTLHARMVSDRP